MKTIGLVCLLAAALLLGATGRLHSANLVANPGFETGNFTGWGTTAASGGSSNFGVNATNPHSDTYAAFFSATNNTSAGDHIYQDFVTPTGTTYDLTFWLAGNINSTDSTLQRFRVTWGSNLLVNTTFPGSFDYTQFTFTGLTPDVFGGGSTRLEFSGYNNNGAFYLDDVSLTRVSAAVPDTGSSALLMSLGLVGVVLTQRAVGWRKLPQQARSIF